MTNPRLSTEMNGDYARGSLDWDSMVQQMRGFTPSGTFLNAEAIIISYSNPNYIASNAYQNLYTDTDLDDLMTTVLAAGYKNIFFKTMQQTFTWNTDSVGANLIIEGDDAAYIILKHSTPDNAYISIGAQTMLINVSVWDKSGADQGLAPNEARIGKFLYNARASTPINTSHWKYQFCVIDTGETATDNPGIAVNQFGIGDAFWAGVVGSGVGYRVHVNEVDPSKWGTGIFCKVYGTGSGIWLVGDSGSAATALAYFQQAANYPSIYIVPSIATTEDLVIASLAKTTGRFINLYQTTSTFSGSGIMMNFAAAAGAFTGAFLDLQTGGITQLSIQPDGNVKFHDDDAGIILKDRTLGTYHRLKLDNGVLSIEAE